MTDYEQAQETLQDALFLSKKITPGPDLPILYSSYAWYTGAAYGNGVYIAVGDDNGYGYYAYATEGSQWQRRTNIGGNSGDKKDVFFANGIFVMIIASGNFLFTSQDGLNWTKRTLSASDYWDNVVYTNGKFFLFPSSQANSRSNIANTFVSSDEGNTWVQGSISNGGVTTSGKVCFDEATGIFYRMVNGVLYSCTDGLTWSVKYNGFGEGIEFGVGNNVIVNTANYNIYYSLDGGVTKKQISQPDIELNNFPTFYKGIFYYPDPEYVSALKVDDSYSSGVSIAHFPMNINNNSRKISVINDILISLPWYQSGTSITYDCKAAYSYDGISWNTETYRKVIEDINNNNVTLDVMCELQGIPMSTLTTAYNMGVNSYE